MSDNQQVNAHSGVRSCGKKGAKHINGGGFLNFLNYTVEIAEYKEQRSDPVRLPKRAKHIMLNTTPPQPSGMKRIANMISRFYVEVIYTLDADVVVDDRKEKIIVKKKVYVPRGAKDITLTKAPLSANNPIHSI